MKRVLTFISALLLSLSSAPCVHADADPPAKPGSLAPHLSVATGGDSSGDAILSWLELSESPDAGSQDEPRSRHRTFALRFARFRSGAWTEPQTVVTRSDFFANWADIPAVVETGDGSLLAWWLEMAGEDTYAYHIILARSTDGGESWRRIGPLHDDRSPTEHGFVSVACGEEGPRLFWLDGRDMTAGDHGHGQGEMQLRTTTLGEGAVPAASGILDSRVCECCVTDSAMTSDGPIVVYRDRGEQETRDISIVRWIDGAWSEPHTVHEDGWRIFGCPVNGPAVDAEGANVVCAWYTSPETEGRVLVAFSKDAGRTWGEPANLAGNEAIGRVDVEFAADGSAIVCWLQADGRDAAVVLQRVNGEGARGKKAIAGRTVASRESGFPQMAMLGDQVLVVWTTVEDNRRRLRSRLMPATLADE